MRMITMTAHAHGIMLSCRKFIDIITDLKLQAGMALLETTELSLYQISEIIGYNSGDYFSKAFRKQYGISASKCRKKHPRTFRLRLIRTSHK